MFDRRLNVQPFDAGKHHAQPLVCDAKAGLEALTKALGSHRAPEDWRELGAREKNIWIAESDKAPAPSNALLPSDAMVIGAVQRAGEPADIVVCAAGGLPGELHKLWNAGLPGSYHVEYGYSCMGYEIAGGVGVKLACPDREVIVMVGDGSYLMMNSEIATSVMLDAKLIIVLLDNRGYGCINRLQQATGSAPFNNMFDDCVQGRHGMPMIDFAAHARSLGAIAEHVADIAGLEAALQRARAADRTYLISIDTDHTRTTDEGGTWWDVAIPEVSTREAVRDARSGYESATVGRRARNTPA